jgi:hypothetical protein
VEHFDRDVPSVLLVARDIDRRHAAGADLLLDDITIGERGAKQRWNRLRGSE